MQDSAWMDKRVRKDYVENLLECDIILANAGVVPLPPNSTAVCQLLNVGITGPLG
ncbi:hypothetical protein PHMEG_00039831 [Phytophthora megakarya]|uniref:Uncharacterized protein n=1 Tax=Phytophthora megakarya TaxID=4795 RepID=A0A225UEQ6_9STRA|nr:hypothetical protein PHMEG_00039831 [Phytophthora megakarya]